MTDTPNPKAPSADYQAMCGAWDMVDAILGGAECMRATHGGNVSGPAVPYANLGQLNRGEFGPQSPYLPRFPNEGALDYECRRRHAPFTNIYADVSDNLASKPFSKKLDLDEAEPEDLKALAENIDGQGNNLHVFGREVFKSGIDKGAHWVLIDHTNVPQGITLADERAMGARPYWVTIPANRMLAVHSAFVSGQETIYHARIYEPVTKLQGYEECCVDRVRVLQRETMIDAAGQIVGFGGASWELYEAQTSKDAAGKEETSWISIGQGVFTIGVIPLVPFIPAGRHGMSWRVKMPLIDIAYMQVEEFQQESNLKTIKEMTAFPMLAGNGVMPTDSKGADLVVPVGPRAVLFAPPGGDGQHGEWKFIEPAATSLTFLQADLEKIRTEMRNLGRQPLTSANLTVVTTANVAAKAHNAVQAWALLFKDAMEQAWKITCLWLGQKLEPVVNVHTDFGVDLTADKDVDALLKAEAQSVLSKRTVQEEFKRRGVLSDDFDPDEEEEALAEQDASLEPEQPIDPRTGQPIIPGDMTPPNGVPLQ